MINKVLMPKMGSSMEEAKIVKWLKNEGDKVEKGEMIAEIETDKVNIEIEAFVSGILRKIVAPVGSNAPVGSSIAYIGDQTDALPTEEPIKISADNIKTPEIEQPVLTKESPQIESAPITGRIIASPLAKKIAALSNIDLHKVSGTGPGGRIVRRDVEKALNEAPQIITSTEQESSPPKRIELSKMRRAIAQQMSLSKQTVPHFYLTMEVNTSEAEKLRRDFNQAAEGKWKLTLNDIVIAASAKALKQFPQVNASFAETSIELKSDINIGVAIAVEDGLLVPVIQNADKKTLLEISQTAKSLAEKSRQGKLSLSEMSGATFSISNLGMYDIDTFQAIINPPESAILAVGKSETRPVADNGEIKLAEIMKLTLSCDHRVIDGATGARFMQHIKSILEHPLMLFMNAI